MSDLHDRLERACDVLDDLGDSDARDAVIEANKVVMAQKGMLEIIDSQRQTFNALMKKYEAAKGVIEGKEIIIKQLQQENAELKIRLEMEGIEG